MKELLTSELVKITTLITELVILFAITYLTTKAKELMRSKTVKNYTEAIREYDATLFQSIEAVAHHAIKRAESYEDPFTEDELKPLVERTLLTASKQLSAKTGVTREFTSTEIEGITETAIETAYRDRRIE